MKPVPFEYCRPDTLNEALTLAEEFGEDASIIAGGLSLGAMLNMRLVRPKAIIDINSLPELSSIEENGSVVRTGAIVRQAEAIKTPLIKSEVPLLYMALPYVGHFQTRSRGTLGGSVAHADPSAEIPLSLVTLDGSIELASVRGKRKVKAQEFFQGILTTDRKANEMVIGLDWPGRQRYTGYGFTEIAQRHGDFAIVAVAAAATVRENRIEKLSLGIGGVEERPFLAETLTFVGCQADNETVGEIASASASAVDPMADLQANPDYRRQLVRVLVADTLRSAFNDAKQHRT